MKMKLLAALTLLCLLTACGGGGDDPENQDTPARPDPDARTPRIDCVAQPELCK